METDFYVDNLLLSFKHHFFVREDNYKIFCVTCCKKPFVERGVEGNCMNIRLSDGVV